HEPQVRGVLLRAKFHAADVLDPDERAVASRRDDDVLELRHLGQAPFRTDADRERLLFAGRGVTERTRGHLDVLLPKRVHHVARREAARGETAGIQPEPHGEAALAEDDDVAYAGDALDRVPHV